MKNPAAPILCLLLAAACYDPGSAPVPWAWSTKADDPDHAPADESIHLPAPPLSDGIFPCSDCHDPEIPVNANRREMTMAHTEIVLKHDEEHRWCLDCHDADDRDVLRLANGAPVTFEESYKLCGQCHGDKYRDWRAGVHGRRTGFWDGQKEYLLCVACHDSHAPAFKPIEPMPMPIRPERTR